MSGPKTDDIPKPTHDIPKTKSVLIFVLLADMLNTICREFVSLVDDSESRPAGIATIVLFVLVIAVFWYGYR